jgi:hypothetical protein
MKGIDMKGIAITSLVMLILGMIVVAILGYLIYKVFTGGAGSAFSKEECKAKYIAICSNCINFDYCPDSEPTGCDSDDFGLSWSNDDNTMKTNCQNWME